MKRKEEYSMIVKLSDMNNISKAIPVLMMVSIIFYF
jgi:hypothetical protein